MKDNSKYVKSNRARMLAMPPEARREHMAMMGRARWEKMSVEDRKAISRKLHKAKADKKKAKTA